MNNCTGYCSDPFVDFSVNNCDETFGGGGLNIMLFDCDSEANKNSDYTTATIEADIANGKAVVIRSIKGSSTGATPNAAAANYVAGREPNVKNFTVSMVFNDANVSIDNDAAYEAINAPSGREIASFILTMVDGHSELFVALNSFQAAAIKEIPEDDNDEIHYMTTLTGKMKGFSKVIATPANIY